MVCHAVLSRRRGDNHSFSLRRKLDIIASRERQHSSTLAFTQQGMNSITQVLFTKCYSSSEAVCFILCLCQSVKIAAELIEQQGCRKSKTRRKGLIDWLKLFCLLPMLKKRFKMSFSALLTFLLLMTITPGCTSFWCYPSSPALVRWAVFTTHQGIFKPVVWCSVVLLTGIDTICKKPFTLIWFSIYVWGSSLHTCVWSTCVQL